MECLKCGHRWDPYSGIPKECPRCKSRDYTKPRVYTKRTPIIYKQPEQQPIPPVEKKDDPNNSEKKVIDFGSV